jgi:hypothetical protein
MPAILEVDGLVGKYEGFRVVKGIIADSSEMGENATLFQILPQAGILLGMGIVLFGIATWRFKFDQPGSRNHTEANSAGLGDTHRRTHRRTLVRLV